MKYPYTMTEYSSQSLRQKSKGAEKVRLYCVNHFLPDEHEKRPDAQMR